MKKALLIFSLLTASFITCANGQTIHSVADSVIMGNYIRPADLLSQDVRWNRASTDFFTYWVDSGLYGFYGSQPEILVDGLPIDANFFGWQDLNMLPISNPSAVSYSFNPQVYHGSLSQSGFIDFKNAPIDTGFTADFTFYAGNETEDPGPYNYDSLKTTPNIDRWGPDGEFTLSYKKNKWYTKGLFLFRNHFPTDLAMNSRLHYTSSLLGSNKAYTNHRIYIATRSALMETGYKTSNWHLKARGVYGISKDYLFLQPLGREVPAKTEYKQIAIDGGFKVGNWDFAGYYIGHQKLIDKRINLHSYIFDWNQTKHTFSFSSAYKTDHFTFKPGITYERLLTQAPGLNGKFKNLSTFFLDMDLPTSKDDSINVHLNADYAANEVAKTFGARFPQQMTSGWKLTPSITYTEELPVRQNSFSYWVNRGYSFADELGIPYSNDKAVKKNRLTIFKLENRIRITPQIELRLEQKLFEQEALNIPNQPVKSYEYVTDTKPGVFSVTQEDGTRLAIFSQISYLVNALFRQSLAVNVQQTLSGSERYKNYFSEIHQTKIQYSFDIYPVSDLILSVDALYRSSTTWNEFEAIEGNHYRLPSGIPIRAVTGTFHIKTPAYEDISIGIKKWFWNRRLSTQLSVRNVLNEEIRMHPIGAELTTKFDIRVSLKL